MKKRKKKILFLTDYFYPHWTGLSKALLYWIQDIHRDFDITVLTVRNDKSLKQEEKIFSAKIIREDYLFSFSRSKYSVNILFKYLQIIKNQDVVFINSPSANIFPFAIIAKLHNKKLLIFHQGDLVLPRGTTNMAIEFLFNIFSYLSFLLADKLSTYTQDYAKHSRLLKFFLNKTENIIPPIHLSTPSRAGRQRKKIKSKNSIVLGFAGRFVEEKGFDILFDAMPIILEKMHNICFVFAGETHITYENFFEKNKKKIEEFKNKVLFLGLLKDGDLVKFYKSLDFILITSRSDCFNLVQAEAMYAGIPSIVSGIPGARFLVKETKFGLIFEKDNPIDLANKIIEGSKKKKEILKFKKNVYLVLDNKKNVKKIKKFIIE